VIFLEHKLLYLGQAEPVPEEPYAIPLGKAAIRRPGTDVTIVATQMMVQQALQAATRLDGEGISAEVIDPRTLPVLPQVEVFAGRITKGAHTQASDSMYGSESARAYPARIPGGSRGLPPVLS
jgi:pyruvate/2-oxoglutarate/acetoin dehydrogenase E1 component